MPSSRIGERRQVHLPQAAEKIEEAVGLYLNPPTHAVVLCVDEKTQIQALSRTQPLLPLRPGLPARRTHDYRRNGLTSLYAAAWRWPVGGCWANAGRGTREPTSWHS